MKKATTIYDIAQALKLTPSSVSRALRNHPDISDETKKMVLAAAKKMRYKVNTAAANLRTGQSKTIGIVVPQINNNFFSNVIAGIEEIAHKYHYNLLICQTNELYEKEVDTLNTLIRQNVACIIISLSKTTANTRHLKEAISHNIPVIQFDRTDAALNTIKVVNDNVQSTTAAVKHLHSQGYKRIGFLAGPRQVNIFKDRFDGFKKALKETGLTFYEDLVAFDCLTLEQARQATLRFLESKSKPDAILASADLAALGVLEAAKEKKLKIPNDLGICGYSNEPYTQWTSPTLTTVNQYSFEIGKKVMRAFLDHDHEKKVKHLRPVLVEAELVIRQSTNRKKTPVF